MNKITELNQIIKTQKHDLDKLYQELKSQEKIVRKQHRIQKMGERKQEELLAEIKKSKKETESIYKHTRESIEYASLIQSAVISQEEDMKPYFKDSFVYWMPKDTVGGDIWLFNDLRHEDECILMFIDCTGHGVPGAFVTMIVKAVEREIIGKILENPEMEVSPAWVM